MNLIMPAPAKINLSLWIKGERSDGYHEIVTVMHTIDLFDILSFHPSDRFELTISGNNTLPLNKSNLIVKAANIFKEATGIKPEVGIKLKKRIPIGAGLGGGSSDAASTLKGLNEIYGNPLSEKELCQLAAQIGSDVPFFIKGGLALAYGRGEKIRNYNPTNFKVLLVYPNFQCSTAEVYQNLPPIKRDISPDDAEKLVISPLVSGRIEEAMNNMVNDLELSRASCIEEVKKVKKVLESIGLKPLMSGSGSSVFAILTGDIPDLTPLKNSGWWYKFLSAV